MDGLSSLTLNFVLKLREIINQIIYGFLYDQGGCLRGVLIRNAVSFKGPNIFFLHQ
jgi:hypothetical protein